MKALLVTVALGAAGIANTMADPVYSANVVGFVNVNLTVPAGQSSGWAILSNPLKGTNNFISTILPAPEEGTTIYKWDPAGASYIGPISFTFGAWDPAGSTTTIAPGEGFWINTFVSQTLTFVGEVPQGALSTTIYPNYNMVGSQVPQIGLLTQTLGYTPSEGDSVYQWDNATGAFVNGGAPRQFSFGSWDTEPTIGIAEGFFLQRFDTGQSAWAVTFSVQ